MVTILSVNFGLVIVGGSLSSLNMSFGVIDLPEG